MKFLIITPAKNEGEYIEGLIESLIGQDITPAAWVIIDDGSTDDMVDKIKPYTVKYPWIHLEQRTSGDEMRSGGSKVVRAFYHGYEKYREMDHDVVMKLDADLTLPQGYLSALKSAFESDTDLGLCGGYCMIPGKEGWVREKSHSYHVRGALKAYRRIAFDEIGGVKETWNWDGIDGMALMHRGWKVRVLDQAVLHHRPTSSAYDPVLHAYRSGKEAYRTGSDLGIAIVRSLFKLKVRPFVFTSIHYLKGFLVAWWRNEPKVVDEGLEQFIRSFTYRRIFKLSRS